MSKPSVLLLGARGQLGEDLGVAFSAGGYPLVRKNREDVDVKVGSSLQEAILQLEPDVVVNATAFHNVELCESSVAESFAVNAIAVRKLSDLCDQIGALLIHFSTDYVFNGKASRPYAESSAVDPVNVYGASKAAGEFLLKAGKCENLLIRTSGLFGLAGAKSKGGNFVSKIVRKGSEEGLIRMVGDQVFSPTYTRDLAEAVVQLIESEKRGAFHVTNTGSCSWYDFTRQIFAVFEVDADVVPISTEETRSSVRRPPYSVLDGSKFGGLFKPLRSWEAALDEFADLSKELAMTGATAGEENE